MSHFQELNERGLIAQCTDPVWLMHRLDDSNQPINFYIGFDPTADSLHVGHLLQLVFAKRMIQMGHVPVILIGEGTASIGDPTGKNDMRKVLSRQELEDNAFNITLSIGQLLGPEHVPVNNNDWLSQIKFLDFLQTVGPHFSVNTMLKADCFKTRMNSERGLTFLEFNYMMMQAFDFFKLNQQFDVELQVGGDDQWSNILAGVDLIRKKTKRTSFGLTLPLLTSNGIKMGKTAGNAVWLDKSKTSVFDFFQFWRNVPDQDVFKWLKMLTFLSLDTIDGLRKHDINYAKKMLAHEITVFVHGDDAADLAWKQAEEVFAQQDMSNIQAEAIEEMELRELLVQVGICKSKGEATRLVAGKAITINGQLMTDSFIKVSEANFGSEIVLRKGKKTFHKFCIIPGE